MLGTTPLEWERKSEQGRKIEREKVGYVITGGRQWKRQKEEDRERRSSITQNSWTN